MPSGDAASLIANSTSSVRSGQSSGLSFTNARSTSATTPLTHSTLEDVLWWSGEPKIRVEPKAQCMAVQNFAVNRQSLSKTMVSGKPTSRNTEPLKLRAAASAVDDLNVGTSHTRPVS